MNLWLNRLSDDVPADVKTPAELARYELDSAGVSATLREDPALGDGYRIEPAADGSFVIAGGQAGLLYGAYRLILDRLCGEETAAVSSAPKYGLRMVNCWDNMAGDIERGYAGRSLFFENGRFAYDPRRMRTLGRLLASCGLNVLCINNVNVHDPAQRLLEDFLVFRLNLVNQFATQTQKHIHQTWRRCPLTLRDRVVRFLTQHCIYPAGQKTFYILMEKLAEELNDSYSKETVAEWDSVHQLSLISQMEDAFDIMFDPEDIMEMTSYANGKDLLKKYEVDL